jgi:hypothetical protein
MSRLTRCVLGALAATAMIGCSDSTEPRTAIDASSQNASFASGSGGGGGGGGGGAIVPPAPTPPACSSLSLTPRSGYTPQGFSFAAIWVNVKLKNCGTTPISVQAEVMVDPTGAAAGSAGGFRLVPEAVPYTGIAPQPWTAQPGDSIMFTLDWDFQLYSSSYTTTVNLKDSGTGGLLATCTTISITPKARGLGGSGGGGSNGSSDTACYK